MKKERLVIIITLLTTIAINMVLAGILKNVPVNLLDLQLTTSMDKFKELSSFWTAEQTQSYINHLIIDYLYMISYGLFFTALLHRVKIRVYLLPLVASLFDLGENIIHHKIFLNPEIMSDILIKTTGSFSRIKWLTLGVVIILFFVGLIRSAIKRRG